MAMRFHDRCGKNITLLENNLIAVRSVVEFLDGLAFSEEPLTDDVIFEIQVKGKITIWNGGFSIGVTTIDPDHISNIPSTSARLKETAWIMSGSTILKDGSPIVDKFGPNLDNLREDDCVGVLRTSKGELMFYVNGTCLGVAVENMPERVFAVLDLYGQCVKIRIRNPPISQPIIPVETTVENLIDEDSSSDDDTLNLSLLFEPEEEEISPIIDFNFFPGCTITNINPHDNIRFHPRCGSLIKLSTTYKSAERARPSDEYNNGVILTHRPLYENEMFEVRIDKVIDKWSGSIEMGVTTHNPELMRFPSTMTNMDSGTIMMSGSKILVNGYGTCTDYGSVNLDELRVGDRIALRRIEDKLHYYINGEDQGVAAENVDSKIWGVVDLYGMTIKVTIIDEMEDNNVVDMPDMYHNVIPPHILRPRRRELSLSFHSLRNSNVIVINGGKTAHRPFTHECMTNGLIMTNRTLKTDELFQIRLDTITPKHPNSIAIGVTQLTCNDVAHPYKLTAAKTGTWALIASDIVKDGDIVIPHYVRSLDRLNEGDTIGVMRKDMGMLHFFVNGLDQGPAAFNVPEHVFGIIELHGKLAKASIVDIYIPRYIPVELPKHASAKGLPVLCFHTVRGPNGELDQDRMVATREPNVCEYNYCMFFSSRPIRECEMFEIRVDKLFQTFGTLSIGVTGLKPEDVNFCNIGLAIGMSADSYILNGSCLLKSSNIIANKYPLDLNLVQEGTRVGVMWHSDRTIHFYMDGMDYGPAFCVPHFNVYAVIDLFGSCSQVTYLPNEDRSVSYTTNTEIYSMGIPWTLTLTQSPYSFSEYCGQNVVVMENFTVARRRQVLEPSSSLVFSAGHLVVDEIFEVRVLDCNSPCSGSMRMGVTDINILNAYINRALPSTIANLPHFTAYIEGPNIIYTNPFKEPLPEFQTMSPSLDYVRPYDTIGFKKTADQRIRVYYNSEPCQTYFEGVPDKVYVVIELFGNLLSIQAISKISKKNETTRYQPCIERALEMAEKANIKEVPVDPKSSAIANSRKLTSTFSFLTQHGTNIKLQGCETVAVRTGSYTNGVVIVRQRLKKGHCFMFRIDKLMQNWIGNLSVGAISSTRSLRIPLTAFGFKNCQCWIISEDWKNICGKMCRSSDGFLLENITEQSILKLQFNWDNSLVLLLDDKYRMYIHKVPKKCKTIYPIVDLYGKIKQVSILYHALGMSSSASLNLSTIRENLDDDEFDNLPQKLSLSLSEDDLNLKDRVVSSEIKNLWLQKNLPVFKSNEIIVEESSINSGDTYILREISELPTDVVSTPVMNPETLQHMLYFNWLIPMTDSLEDRDHLNKQWQMAAANCVNLRDAFDYWSSLTAQFEHLGTFLSQGTVYCYCEKCDPDAFPHLSGWIRIERMATSELKDPVYWHPDHEVFDVPYTIDVPPTTYGGRPDIYHGLPKIFPDSAPLLWYNEEGIGLNIRISIELTIGERDLLNSVMLYLQYAPLRNEIRQPTPLLD